MVPPWALTQILIGVAKFLPTKKLVPQKNLAEAAFKDLKKREMVSLFFFLNNLKYLKAMMFWEKS